jgi:hypothetical protein
MVPAPIGTTSYDTISGTRNPARAGTPIEVGVVPVDARTSR